MGEERPGTEGDSGGGERRAPEDTAPNLDLFDQASLKEMLLASERRRAQAEQSRARAEIVLGGLDLLSTAVNVDEVLAGILDIVAEAVPYDSSAVRLENDGRFDVVVSTALAAPFGSIEPSAFTARVLGGRPTVVADLGQVPGLEPLAEEAGGFRSALFAPLHTAGRRALLVCVDRAPAHYSRRHLNVLSYLSPLASQALRRYDEEGRIADLLLQLERSAHTDPLTGLPNRAAFDEALRIRLDEHRRTGAPVALLLVDMDDFKTINDTFGHPAGDHVIRAVADGLRRATRPGDVCARLGGDEFAVLLAPDVANDMAPSIGDRILDQLAEPVDVGDSQVVARVSIGIGLVTSNDAEPERVVELADRALYWAKGLGGSRVQSCDGEMQASWNEERLTAQELEAALAGDQLELHYQPIRASDSLRVTGLEVLLRWSHPTRGLLAAAEFLPAARNNELIVDVGRWVVSTALAELAEWLGAGADRRVAINIAVRELLANDFLSNLCAAAEACDVALSQVEVELGPEPITRRREAVVDQILGQVVAAGIGVTVGVLGTGASTLDRVLSLPNRRIKIGRRFTGGLPSDHHDRAVVEAMTSFGRHLGAGTVLEGVETVEQLQLAKATGIAEVQGVLLDHPRPFDELNLTTEIDRFLPS